MDVRESYSSGWCVAVLLRVCGRWLSLLLFSLVEGIDEMFGIVVLLEGFVEVVEFFCFCFGRVAVCVYTSEQGSKAAYLVLCRMVAVVI